MNITTTEYPKSKPQTDSVESFPANAMYDDHDGVAERAQRTADNVARALGRLLDLMAERHGLSAEDLTNIAGVYASTATLTPSEP